MSGQLSTSNMNFVLIIILLFCKHVTGDCTNSDPFVKGTNMFEVLGTAALGELKTFLQLCNYKPIENYVTLWCTTSGTGLFYEVPLNLMAGDSIDPVKEEYVKKHIKLDGKIAFIVHGYTDYPKFNDDGWHKVTALKVAEEIKGTACLVGYREICDCAYSQVVQEIVPAVGRGVAGFINTLQLYLHVQPSTDVFLIGHSIGGQIVGFIGKNMTVKPYMIISLDPAGLLFTRDILGLPKLVDAQFRLAPTDGIHVIAIHTEYAVFGTFTAMAQTDIFINNGLQPGCILPGCSHARALYYHYATLQIAFLIPISTSPNAAAFSWGIKYPPPPPGIYHLTIGTDCYPYVG